MESQGSRREPITIEEAFCNMISCITGEAADPLMAAEALHRDEEILTTLTDDPQQTGEQ